MNCRAILAAAMLVAAGGILWVVLVRGRIQRLDGTTLSGSWRERDVPPVFVDIPWSIRFVTDGTYTASTRMIPRLRTGKWRLLGPSSVELEDIRILPNGKSVDYQMIADWVDGRLVLRSWTEFRLIPPVLLEKEN
jgi:hypothetical protein